MRVRVAHGILDDDDPSERVCRSRLLPDVDLVLVLGVFLGARGVLALDMACDCAAPFVDILEAFRLGTCVFV